MAELAAPEKPTLIGVTVKLTPAEHEALKAVMFTQGFGSFQSYFRHFALREIREATGQPQEPAHAAP
jgi:hypothetical protein